MSRIEKANVKAKMQDLSKRLILNNLNKIKYKIL